MSARDQSSNADAATGPAASAEQWVVWNDGYMTDRYSVGRLVKQTAKTFTVSQPKWRNRRCSGSPMFIGPQSAAEILTARLNSSVALSEEERRLARERHRSRVADLIARATGAA